MRQRGYTLIETLLVIALISIVLGITLPKTNYFMDIKELRELENFKRDLMFTRNRAIMESKNYTVQFNVSQNSYSVRPENNIHKRITTKFASGIRIDDLNNVTSFTFMYNGTTKDSGTLYLRNRKNKKYKVSVSPVTGRINLDIKNSK